MEKPPYRSTREQTINPANCYAGVIGFIGAIIAIYFIKPSPLLGAGLCLIATFTPIIILDFRQIVRPPSVRPNSTGEVWIKVLALAAILTFISTVYWLLPLETTDLYEPFLLVHNIAFIAILTLAFPYFHYWDKRILNPEKDPYLVLGKALLRRAPITVLRDTGHLIPGWIVKGFFTPVMLAFLVSYIERITTTPFSLDTFALFYIWCITLFYCADTTFGLGGYLLTLRSLDSQIKSVDSTPLGWGSALICYPPFNYIWLQNIHYAHGKKWYDWFENHPILGISWGFAILALTFIYVWSTIIFGLRFSNLTNRGIIRHGPYRLTKHPAYLCKNLAWWLTYLPFIGFADFWHCVWASASLVLLNTIYFLRAKTEERHLKSDPEYMDYCMWLQTKSALRKTKFTHKKAS